MMNQEQKALLLKLAEETIRSDLDGQPVPTLQTSDPLLTQPGCCFVTLHRRGQLRGCIGSLEPVRPLVEDVVHNARAAAFHDPRFPPLTGVEWADTDLDISVLGNREPLQPGDRAQLLAQIRPGRDGLVIEGPGGQRATFLPAVWTQLPDPEDFLQHLKLKAGLPVDLDEHLLAVWRYEVEELR